MNPANVPDAVAPGHATVSPDLALHLVRQLAHLGPEIVPGPIHDKLIWLALLSNGSVRLRASVPASA
ncbi:hypothetical protein SBBP2_1670006 [Burkholderiales bacterium]|nr:hypothetical protein SBBP2_1670006 [Burkholderiales bacterium]